MSDGVYVFQFPEFINEVKVGQEKLAQKMEGQSVTFNSFMFWDTKIKGLSKLNMFVLVPEDLYQIIKSHQWSNGGVDWKGFRGGPANVGYDIMIYHPPAVNLPGSTVQEVGGYEKQAFDRYGQKDRYYNPAEPNLNLEFKWNSGAQVTVNTGSGKRSVPEISYVLNVHVKQVKGNLEQGRLYDY